MKKLTSSLSERCIVRARGFLWGTTSEGVRSFFSDCQVEAVNFVDDLHGECYVELKSTDDLAHALDKHALRVGTRTRKRLIEVYPATLLEMNRALMKGEGSEAASSRRRRQGREERGRMRMKSSGRSQTSRSRTSRSRTEVKRSGSSARSQSRRWHRTRNTSMEEKGTTDSSMSLNQYCTNKVSGSLRRSSESQTSSSQQEVDSSPEGRKPRRSKFSREEVPREESIDIKRVKREISSSPSPSPRYQSRKENDPSTEKTVLYHSTVKTESFVKDQQMEILELKELEIETHIREITKRVEEVEVLSEENKLKNEELESLRMELQVKDDHNRRKDGELLRLNQELEKYMEEAGSLKAKVKCLLEKSVEDEKRLKNLANAKECSSKELFSLKELVTSLKSQIGALQENVNQLKVEKELIEMKSSKLQTSNESLRGRLAEAEDKELVMKELRSFLDSGRAEIADMREELMKMKKGNKCENNNFLP